jgi:uncharacterized protein YprB with RNaseH-like and TPR domain
MASPNILFFDIETGGVNALKSDLGFCLMVGYKWNYEKSARVLTIEHRHLRHFNDGPLLRAFSAIYNKADLTVAHFGSVFDRRFIQGRLLINNLPAIPFTKMRDTCMIARSVANYSSNRLKTLGTTLDLKNQKEEKGTGWPLWWFGAMQGDMGAVRKMAHYCKHDVLATEELYYRLLPFDNAHPRVYFKEEGEAEVCGHCGGKVEYRGTRLLNNKRYRRYRCLNSNFKKTGKICGKWGHVGKAIK